MREIRIRQADDRTFRWPQSADLVIADPPWTYSQAFAATNPNRHFPCLSTDDIIGTLARIPGHRLACWMTGPLLDEFVRRTQAWSWGRIREEKLAC